MSQSIVIPGRAAPETRLESETFDLGAMTTAASIFILRVASNPDNTNLVGSPRLIRIGVANSGSGFSLSASGGDLTGNLSWRTSSSSHSQTFVVTPGDILVLAQRLVLDPVGGNGVLKQWVNGVKLGDDIATDSGVYHGQTNDFISIAGAIMDGRDIEHYAVAFWEGDIPSETISRAIPTETELQNFQYTPSLSAAFGEMSVAPTRGFIASGAPGAYAGTISAAWGGNNLTRTQGANSGDADMPYFSLASGASVGWRSGNGILDPDGNAVQPGTQISYSFAHADGVENGITVVDAESGITIASANMVDGTAYDIELRNSTNKWSVKVYGAVADDIA